MSQAFRSILFPSGGEPGPNARAPACFEDLNLGPVVEAAIDAYRDYDLAAFFCTPLDDPAAIGYRQEVLRELEDPEPASVLSAATMDFRTIRACLRSAGEYDYPWEGERWFLRAIEHYARAVRDLEAGLTGCDLRSAGLRGFREYVSQYAATAGFTTLAREAPRIAAELGALRYNLRIDDNRVTVLPRRGEPDFAALVLEAFDRFRRAPVQDYRTDFADPGRLNHVEAQILQGIARLHPATFRALAEFVAAHTEFIDPVLARFDREVQFYRAWRALVHPLEAAGRRFCYPGFTPSPGAVEIREGFDLALALRLGPAGPVVCNDLALDASERIVVVSGPNQGGKTTYARMVGQVHYLTRLGCSVPARSARVPVCDGVYAHFERREDPGSLRGKLKQDLERMREILARVTPASLVLVNEPFASTTLADALYLSRRVLERLTESGPLVVWVTFLDELAAFGPATVSLASAVDVAHPSLRTFRFERRPPDGLAYAHAVAEKYGLTAAWLVSGPVE